MNKALEKHHKAIARQEQIEIAAITIFSAGLGIVFVGFGVISALIGA